MISFRLRSINTAVLLGFIASAVGCTGGSSPPQASNLRGVMSLYTVAERELGHIPRSEEEFAKFVRDRGGKVLERFGANSVDELLTSPRDGKPYVVLFGPPTSKEAQGIVAYESEGVDGKHEVGFDSGEIRELNAEQFAALGL